MKSMTSVLQKGAGCLWWRYDSIVQGFTINPDGQAHIVPNQSVKAGYATDYNIIRNRVWENMSYLHKTHLFVLWRLAFAVDYVMLCVLHIFITVNSYEFCKLL